jgi:hypothetical protein
MMVIVHCLFVTPFRLIPLPAHLGVSDGIAAAVAPVFLTELSVNFGQTLALM